MFDLRTLDDISLLAEGFELECKLAQGQDGKGELPKDFWPTYSAMANAHGGVVLLGIRESSSGQFTVAGIENVAKVRGDLFNGLSNREKVSANLLTDGDVQEAVVDGRSVLVVHIPPATRKQKPVYLHGRPLGNTYRRLNDGDRVCDDETVKRMLAEQVEVAGRCGRLADRQVVVDTQLQEAFDPSARVIGTGAFVTVGEQQHDARLLRPLGEPGGDELVDDDLRTLR